MSRSMWEYMGVYGSIVEGECLFEVVINFKPYKILASIHFKNPIHTIYVNFFYIYFKTSIKIRSFIGLELYVT